MTCDLWYEKVAVIKKLRFLIGGFTFSLGKTAKRKFIRYLKRETPKLIKILFIYH